MVLVRIDHAMQSTIAFLLNKKRVGDFTITNPLQFISINANRYLF
jgi:hypothetical protein